MANGRGWHAKKIDTVHWTGFGFSQAALAAGTPIGVNLAAAQHLPETLLRIRGTYMVVPDGVLGPGAATRIRFGICQVPEGTGTTVVWSPTDDPDAPWIWYDTVQLWYEEAVADVIAYQNTASAAREIDSKAMRKLRNTELQLVMHSATLGNALTVNIAGSGRFLAGS